MQNDYPRLFVKPEPVNIEGAMRELQERISATERQLQEEGGEQTDKGAAIHRELNGMRERMQQLRRRAAATTNRRRRAQSANFASVSLRSRVNYESLAMDTQTRQRR